MMKKITTILIVLLGLVLDASADTVTLSGYYEPFSTTNPPSNNWYSLTCQDNVGNSQSCSSVQQFGGALTAGGGKIISAQTTSGEAWFNFNNGAELATGDWSFEYDWTAVRPRCCNTGPQISIGIRFGSNGIGFGTIHEWEQCSPQPSCNVGGVVGESYTKFRAFNSGCSLSNVDDTSTTRSGHAIISFVRSTDTVTIYDGVGTACQPFGAGTTQYRVPTFVKVFDSMCNGCSVTNFILNINNGHTFQYTTVAAVVQPSEFDTGLKAAVAGLGFATPQSQFLFVLIMVGLGTILAAAATQFFGDGSGRVWMIHGFAALIGIFAVLLLFIELWAYSLALILGTVVARGGREFINTYRSLALYRKAQPATIANDMEIANDLNPNPVDLSGIGQKDGGETLVNETVPQGPDLPPGGLESSEPSDESTDEIGDGTG